MEIKCLLDSVTEKEQIKSDLENRIATTESAIDYLRRELAHQQEKEKDTNSKIIKFADEIEQFEKLLFQSSADLESEKASYDNVQMTTENMSSKLSTLKDAERMEIENYELQTTELSHFYASVREKLKTSGMKWEDVQALGKTFARVK